MKGDTKKKVIRILGVVAAVVLVFAVGTFANGLVGNPVSYMLANHTAKEYLAKEYADTDYVLTEVSFNFKDTNYYAKIKSPSSKDTYFTFYIDMFGNLTYDNYESLVTNGYNTARRLSEEYRALTDTVFQATDFPYQSERNMCFGDLRIESVEWETSEYGSHVLMMEDLELDGVYDVSELGKEAGELTISIEEEEVTVERAAEILLETKALLEEKNIGVACVDFMLQKPISENVTAEEELIWIEDFLWEDIYKEGLEDRIQEAHDKWQEHVETIEK